MTDKMMFAGKQFMDMFRRMAALGASQRDVIAAFSQIPGRETFKLYRKSILNTHRRISANITHNHEREADGRYNWRKHCQTRKCSDLPYEI